MDGRMEGPKGGVGSGLSLGHPPLCSGVTLFCNNVFLRGNREKHPNHMPEGDCSTGLAPRGKTAVKSNKNSNPEKGPPPFLNVWDKQNKAKLPIWGP